MGYLGAADIETLHRTPASSASPARACAKATPTTLSSRKKPPTTVRGASTANRGRASAYSRLPLLYLLRFAAYCLGISRLFGALNDVSASVVKRISRVFHFFACALPPTARIVRCVLHIALHISLPSVLRAGLFLRLCRHPLLYDQSSFSPLPMNSKTAQAITPTRRSRYTGKSTLCANTRIFRPAITFPHGTRLALIYTRRPLDGK